MENKNKSLETQNFTESQFLYTILRDTKLVGFTSMLDLNGFTSFFNALKHHYTIRLSASNKYIIASKLIIFYVAFHFAHDSRVLKDWAVMKLSLTLPIFVYNILVRVASESQSANKLSGVVQGKLNCNPSSGEDFCSILLKLSKLSRPQWQDIFASTELSSCVSTEENFNTFINAFKATQTKLFPEFSRASSRETVSLYIASSLRSFIDVLSNPQDIVIFNGTLDSYTTSQFTIFRFSNTANKFVYKVSQHTLKISSVSRDIYLCFLRLFTPTFTIDGNPSSVTSIGPTDMEFSVEHVPLDLAWYFYLSINTITTDNVNSPKKAKPNPKQFNHRLNPKLRVDDKPEGTQQYSTIARQFIPDTPNLGKVVLIGQNHKNTCYFIYSTVYYELNRSWSFMETENFTHILE